MKTLQHIGLGIFLTGLAVFVSLLFVGTYKLTPVQLEQLIQSKGIQSEVFVTEFNNQIVGKSFSNSHAFSTALIAALDKANATHKKEREWSKVIWSKPNSFAYDIIKSTEAGVVAKNKALFWWLTFGLGILGALLFILPNVVLLGPPGIKNAGIWHSKATNRGWIGWMTFLFLVGFYILLYFYPNYIVNWVYLVDPISLKLSGNLASQWFLYGFLYCVVMTVMAVRMYIK